MVSKKPHLYIGTARHVATRRAVVIFAVRKAPQSNFNSDDQRVGRYWAVAWRYRT